MTEIEFAEAPPTDRKWFQCNGQQLRKMAHAGLLWLDHNHEEVNALNVFPVPDGDTGTNMLLTMRSAYKQIQTMDSDHVGKVASNLSHGALMGARGNSGVILSQIWRGLAKPLKEKETFNADDLAEALKSAADNLGAILILFVTSFGTFLRNFAANLNSFPSSIPRKSSSSLTSSSFGGRFLLCSTSER